MALSDLLWACPACGQDRGLQNDDHTCDACGTRFARHAGAVIRATAPDGRTTMRPAAEWVDRLPDVRTFLGRGERTAPRDAVAPGEGTAASDPIIRSARVTLRTASGELRVHGEAGYLNRVEVFGEARPGSLQLAPDRLIVTMNGEEPEEWPLEALTAVQGSSSTLQVKRRGQPLVAIRFEDDSNFLWEQLLHEALRDFYGRTGRGEIREFQPRIVVR